MYLPNMPDLVCLACLFCVPVLWFGAWRAWCVYFAWLACLWCLLCVASLFNVLLCVASVLGVPIVLCVASFFNVLFFLASVLGVPTLLGWLAWCSYFVCPVCLCVPAWLIIMNCMGIFRHSMRACCVNIFSYIGTQYKSLIARPSSHSFYYNFQYCITA